MAADAAYASYDHQQRFAVEHGSMPLPAALWPLSVDGLVVLASLALLDVGLRTAQRRVRWVVRAAFVVGVCVSLVANIAAAPVLDWQAVVVAGWPPVALLLAVELLAHDRRDTDREHTETQTESDIHTETDSGRDSHGGETVANVAQPQQESTPEAESAPGVVVPLATGAAIRARRGHAEQLMWSHYQTSVAAGAQPSGAELDRVAGTRDYGRAVLARWRREGRIPTNTDPHAQTTTESDTVTESSTTPTRVLADTTTGRGENATESTGTDASTDTVATPSTVQRPDSADGAGDAVA